MNNARFHCAGEREAVQLLPADDVHLPESQRHLQLSGKVSGIFLLNMSIMMTIMNTIIIELNKYKIRLI
jgi:hypothetical protein